MPEDQSAVMVRHTQVPIFVSDSFIRARAETGDSAHGKRYLLLQS